jgi:hypothetical protein
MKTRAVVGYWNFDEAGGTTAYDGSDYGNDGTLYNNPAWTAGAPAPGGGSQGTALQFDGVDDYVDCGSNESLDITDAITIEAWVKLADIPVVSPVFHIIASKHSAVNEAYNLVVSDTTKKARFILIPSSGWADRQRVESVTSILDDSWHHKSYLKIYVDGQQEGEVAWAQSIGTNASSLYVGGNPDGDRVVDGLIDEVRIYNRALSAEEIRYHYNRGGPVAHWKFDEGNGTTTYDSTNNNNDGTLGDGSCSPGSGTCPTWTTGKFGSALSFDGVDDYVEVPDDVSLNFGTGDFTLEAWVNGVAANQTSDYPEAFGNRDPVDSLPRAGIAFTQAGHYRNFAVDSDGVGGVPGNQPFVLDGNWHHLVLVIDYDVGFLSYLDGNLIETISLSFTGNFNFNAPTHIGYVKSAFTTMPELQMKFGWITMPASLLGLDRIQAAMKTREVV